MYIKYNKIIYLFLTIIYLGDHASLALNQTDGPSSSSSSASSSSSSLLLSSDDATRPELSEPPPPTPSLPAPSPQPASLPSPSPAPVPGPAPTSAPSTSAPATSPSPTPSLSPLPSTSTSPSPSTLPSPSSSPPAPVQQPNITVPSFVQFIKPKSKFNCTTSLSGCLNGFCDQNSGLCYCKPGYTGETCNIDIDECRQVQEPCFNNGTCENRENHYVCHCKDGFKGELCQESIDMCESAPCMNMAKCINHRTSYTCQCEPGWQGEHCDVNINECQSIPCQNNGTCHDLINDYRCDCGQSGFMGKNCEINIDDCESKPCGLGAKECVDLINDFKCLCHDGWEGKRCEKDIDECLFNKCENNGTCIQNSINLHNLDVNNTLPADFTTSYHEIGGALNISHYAGFTCECKQEYYGDRCEEKKKCYTKSIKELCNHPQAECVNQGSTYDCQINASFDGHGEYFATYRVNDDQFKVHEIYVKYRSLTGGVIMSFETTQPGSPIADLQLNKSGLYLSGGPINRNGDIKFDGLLDGNEREIRLALDTPTEIRSVTVSRKREKDEPIDSEHPPFKGCLMQVRLNNLLVPFIEYPNPNHTIFNLVEHKLDIGQCKTCFPGDCMNGGSCDLDTHDHCSCPSAYTGTFCELDVDECEKLHCHNGGTCENLVGGYQCNCKEGYRGEHCQEIGDYCKAKQPCQQGACKNINSGQGTYQCECHSSHIGKRCDRRRDCKNECHHQAQCINNVTCACLPGKREMCEFIARCDQIDGDLCRNRGTCRNHESGSGYYCDCQEPYFGLICEHEKSSPDLLVIVVVLCVVLIILGVVVFGIMLFRGVRKARATRGTYSPSTQEKFGNSACDLLKPPQPERLI